MTSQRNAIGAITITTYEHKLWCFEDYIKLLYRGLMADHLHVNPSIPAFTGNETKKAKKAALEEATLNAVDIEFERLINLYVFCEHVQDLDAKKVLLSTLVESTRKIRYDDMNYYPSEQDVVHSIYAKTPTGDPMREFLVDCFVIKGTHEWIRHTSATDYPPEFLFDVLATTFEYRSKPESELFSRLEDAAHYCNKLDMPKST
jgi:hypothetical protein